MTMRGWLTVVAVAVGLVVGCGGSSKKAPSGTTDKTAWGYTQNYFVIDSLTLPLTEADVKSQDFGFDLDGNGTVDNQLFSLVVALLPQFQSGTTKIDLQQSVDDMMQTGSIVILESVYANDMQDQNPANLWAFLGASTAVDAGTANPPHAGGTYTVDTTNGPKDATFGGYLRKGAGQFGGTNATLKLTIPLSSFSPGSPDLTVTLSGVQVYFEVSADGTKLENGKIGGAILESDINGQILPAVATILDNLLATGCGARNDGGMPDGGTGVCECIAGSGTAQIESFLDDPQDCHITTDKLLANTLLSAIFKGDITLNGQKALSLGFGFTAVSVPAFTHDPPPQ